jgi:hypothetical protein
MKIGRRIIYWIVVLALVFVTFWLRYARRSGESLAEEKVVAVEVEVVGTGPIEETIESMG